MTSTGEHYGRTDSGELIGPYDTIVELERELADANREHADQSETYMATGPSDNYLNNAPSDE